MQCSYKGNNFIFPWSFLRGWTLGDIYSIPVVKNLVNGNSFPIGILIGFGYPKLPYTNPNEEHHPLGFM